MNTPRRLDPEATRQAILEAAYDLFAERGAGRVSMSEIAKTAGITKSLIHHHFGSKKDLWNAVREHGISEYLELQGELLRTRTADEGLFRDSIDMYFRFLKERPKLVRLMGWMAVDPDAQSEKGVDGVMHLGVQRLQEGKANGLVREDVDELSSIIAFLSTIERWFIMRRFFCGPLEGTDAESMDERFLETIKNIFERGMKPE